jgi:ankyrin repeat protein
LFLLYETNKHTDTQYTHRQTIYQYTHTYTHLYTHLPYNTPIQTTDIMVNLDDVGLNQSSQHLQPFFDKVVQGDLKGLKALLSTETAADAYDYRGYNHSLLTLAIRKDTNQIVKYLLNGGANPNLLSPLAWASLQNNLGAAIMLMNHPNTDLEQAANLWTNSNMRTSPPLLVAIKKGHVEMAKLLLSKGAKVRPGYLRQVFVAHKGKSGASRATRFALIDLLIHHGADINDLGPNKLNFKIEHLVSKEETALMLAVTHDMDPAVDGEFLTRLGVNVGKTDAEGKNALFYAVEKKSLRWVQYLLQHGTDVNCMSKNGATPIFNATDIPIAKVLLEHGAHLNTMAGPAYAMDIAFNSNNAMEWLDLFESLDKRPRPTYVSMGNGMRILVQQDFVPLVNRLKTMSEGNIKLRSIFDKCMLHVKHRKEWFSCGADMYGCQPKLMENFVRLLELKYWAVDQTMIVTALEGHEVLLTKQLLKHVDAPMDFTNVDFSHVVAWGIQHGEMEMLQLLVSLGIPINYVNIQPLTGVARIWCQPQDNAAILARNAMVRLVLEHGAHDLGQFVAQPYQNANIRNVINKYKAQLAKRLSNPDKKTLNTLCTKTGHSLMHIAVLHGTIADVRSLADRGASVLLKTRYGMTAVDLARTYQREDMLVFLENVVPYEHLMALRKHYQEVYSKYMKGWPLRLRDYAIVQSTTTNILSLDPNLFDYIKKIGA